MPIVLKAYQEIPNKQMLANVISNAVSNLMSDAGDRLANDYVLTLTDEDLQIEQIGYSEWGGVPEVRKTETLKRDQIQEIKLVDEHKLVIKAGDDQEELVFFYEEPQKEFAEQMCFDILNE